MWIKSVWRAPVERHSPFDKLKANGVNISIGQINKLLKREVIG
ncbi:hypothetical protein [Sideroxydans sp. CL21]|nr:hypothetical protein [Sideroxydans sp. CL21]